MGTLAKQCNLIRQSSPRPSLSLWLCLPEPVADFISSTTPVVLPPSHTPSSPPPPPAPHSLTCSLSVPPWPLALLFITNYYYVFCCVASFTKSKRNINPPPTAQVIADISQEFSAIKLLIHPAYVEIRLTSFIIDSFLFRRLVIKKSGYLYIISTFW